MKEKGIGLLQEACNATGRYVMLQEGIRVVFEGENVGLSVWRGG